MANRYLELSLEERELLTDLRRRLDPDLDGLLADVSAELRETEEVQALFRAPGVERQVDAALREYVDALGGEGQETYIAALAERAETWAAANTPLGSALVLLLALRSSLVRRIPALYEDEASAHAARDALLRLVGIQVVGSVDSFVRMKEETITAQHEAMLSLSTPVVEVWQGVLALPLVGTIDTDRARRVTQRLLDAIRTTQARIVIVDISGVPLVDTAVANHLMKTIAAARLLGARGIIVGISPEVADTLVSLDVDLIGTETYFSLRQGLEASLDALGFAVLDQARVDR